MGASLKERSASALSLRIGGLNLTFSHPRYVPLVNSLKISGLSFFSDMKNDRVA